MDKKLKEKIVSAYQNDTPDIKEKVINACQNEIQYPAPEKEKKSFFKRGLLRVIATITACFILFGVGLGVGTILPKKNNTQVLAEETSVYLDVNPSVKLALDKNNKVVSCEALNQDAQAILNGMNLSGIELNTALNAIVGSMYINGYLTPTDNSMLVSVETSKTDKIDFLNDITKQINDIFEKNTEMKCAIIAQTVSTDTEIKERAKNKGVSVGKICLVDKITNSLQDLSTDEKEMLFNMSIKDLNLMYYNKPAPEQKPEEQPKEEEKEVVTGTPSGNITREQALTALLLHLQKDVTLIERVDVFVKPSLFGTRAMVFAITIKFKQEETIYKYEVDCVTAEIKQVQTNNAPPVFGDPEFDGGQENEPEFGGGGNDKPNGQHRDINEPRK